MLSTYRPYFTMALLALGIFYFGIHALTGDRGLLTGQSREAALTSRTAELERLRAERIELETRAHLLSDRSLSRDLLEERARVLLGFSDQRDYIIRIAH